MQEETSTWVQVPYEGHTNIRCQSEKIEFSRQHGAWEPYIPGLVMLHLRKKYNILGPVDNNKEKTGAGGVGEKAITIPDSGCTQKAFCGPRLDHYGRVGEQNHVYIKELCLTILSKQAIQFCHVVFYCTHFTFTAANQLCRTPKSECPIYFIYLQHITAQLDHYHGDQHKMTYTLI